MDQGFSNESMDLVSVLYGAVALVVLVAVARRGRGFWRGEVASADRQLTWAIAFFLVLPLGVLLHEFGHALATWSMGGEVAQISWRVYWGFMVPVGLFSPLEHWWISLAGNAAGLLFGFVLLALAGAAGRSRPPLGRVLLVAGQLEIIFTLVVYPLMTIGGYFDGDWSTIYDFGSTPVASTITLAVHAAVLIGLWLARRRLAEADWAISRRRADELARLRAAIRKDPADVGARHALARLFLDGGRRGWAAEASADGLRACGENAALYATLAEALMKRGQFNEALGAVTRAIELTEHAPETRMWLRAHRAIALTAVGRCAEAVEAFSALEGPAASDPAVLHWMDRARAAA